MDSWKYSGAADEPLDGPARRQSTKREMGLVGAMISLVWWLVIRTYLKLVHRLKTHGKSHLPKDPGFVIVANHASHLDSLVLAASLPLRWNGHVFPLAAGDTFFHRPDTAVFATFCLNALPLWRKKASGRALADLRDRVANHEVVLMIFPEGTRSRDGAMGRFKPGIGRLVSGTATKVVPAYIQGAHRAFPPNAKLPRFHSVRVRFGEALDFSNTPDTREGWNEVATRLQEAVCELENGI